MSKADFDWEDVGEIKHRIRHSLTAVIKIENLSKQLTQASQQLQEEVKQELDKLDRMVDKASIINKE